MTNELTHIDDHGRVTMVDVGGKPSTERIAKAGCVVRVSARTMDLLQVNALPKGDALQAARIAGIQAAKKTWELIPLCHPLLLTFADVTFSLNAQAGEIGVQSEVRTTGQTGVEMEAMVAVQVAALTIYDMCKAVQKDIEITDCRLLFKSGGKSGTFVSPFFN